MLCRHEQSDIQNTTETLVGPSGTVTPKESSITETVVQPRLSVIPDDGDDETGPFTVIFAIDGMTCSSCVGNVTRATAYIPGITNVSVNLVSNSASAMLEKRDLVDVFKSSVEDSGYGCELVSVDRVTPIVPKAGPTTKPQAKTQGPYRVIFSVDGMTCASCVGNVTRALEDIKGVSEVGVDLVHKSAVAVIDVKELADVLKEAIEDSGYGAEIVGVEDLDADQEHDEITGPRTVSLKIEGMFCQ